MKWILSLLLGTLAAFILTDTAHATPEIYRFDGTISSIVGGGVFSNAALATAAGLHIGDSVTYSFLVDLAAPGTTTSGGVATPVANTSNTTYFYDQYFSGSVIQGSGGGPNTGLNHNNYGYNVSNSPYFYKGALGTTSWFDNGWESYSMSIFTSNSGINTSTVPTWIPGVTHLQGENWAYLWYLGPSYSLIGSDLTLTSITSPQTAPTYSAVPEPSTLLLLGSGMTGLVTLRRFRKK